MTENKRIPKYIISKSIYNVIIKESAPQIINLDRHKLSMSEYRHIYDIAAYLDEDRFKELLCIT